MEGPAWSGDHPDTPEDDVKAPKGEPWAPLKLQEKEKESGKVRCSEATASKTQDDEH